MADTLAIDGGRPVRKSRLPSWPIHGEREEQLLLEVLRSGRWDELTGDKVATFARQFSEFHGAEFGVCVPNGTIALEVGLEALGVGPGDEIITTAYTFIATAASAFAVGARPVFVDIDPNTNNIDPARIPGAITDRTKAIVPVHIAGQPADMDGVQEVAKKHGIPVLEDACQAWGSSWKGQSVGAIGDLGAFSFQASKNITAGEGGIVITNEKNLYDRAWSLHNVGRLPEGGWYQHDLPGKNLRMTEWQGAILIAQLERLPEAMDRRQRSAEILTAGLGEIPGLTPMHVDERVTGHAWHLFQTRYDPAAFGGRDRSEFLNALNAEGVESSSGYVPLTYQEAIRTALRTRFGKESLANLAEVPMAEYAGDHTVWFNQMLLLGSDKDMQEVITACRKIQRAWG